MATMGFIKTNIETENKKTENNPILVPETFTHSIAFGQTGCGKTSSYIYPNLQKRIQMGHGILLYDYKGKEHLSVKYFAHKAGRLDDVIEIGKPWGASINFVKNMDEDEIDRFFSVVLKHDNSNKFWENSAKSLGQTVLAVLKGIEDFTMAYYDITKIRQNMYLPLDFGYPADRTIASLVKVCKTYESLNTFIRGLDSLDEEFDDKITAAVKHLRYKYGESTKAREKLVPLLAAKKRFQNIIKEKRETLEVFGEDANENLVQNVIGTLSSPLASIAQNKFYNTDEYDIVKELNEGKIVILNVEALSSAMVESLSNALLYELSKRTKYLSSHPVSVFIDEVQRVVGKDFDLPIDVFREAKVDLFLATQNSSLLKDKLGEEKFEAMMGNLTNKFYFKSSANEEIESEQDLQFLETFEYLCSSDKYAFIHTAKPIFLHPVTKLKVEYAYQKRLEVLKNFLYKYEAFAVIADYDARLYKSGKLIMIDLKTQREVITDVIKKHEQEDLLFEANKLIKRNMRYAS